MVNAILREVALFCLFVMVTSSLVSFHELYPPKPYKFGYAIKDKHGEQYREETRDGLHDVKGSYGFVDERGIKRQVYYVADKEGFRAEVKTNEPGTAPENPAAVKMTSSAAPFPSSAKEEATSETTEKESPISASELEKLFRYAAETPSFGLGGKLYKESVFGKEFKLSEVDSAVGKEVAKEDAKVKFDLEQFFNTGFEFSPLTGNAGLPFAKKEVSKKFERGKKFGLEYLIPDKFALFPADVKGKAELGENRFMFSGPTVLQKFKDLGLGFIPFMDRSLDTNIEMKSAPKYKGLGMEHLLKGIALVPLVKNKSQAFVPIYGL